MKQEDIEKEIYNLCIRANTKLPQDAYAKLFQAFEQETNKEAKQALELILQNAKLAEKNKLPLCQDTGQVMVFVSGRDIPNNIEEIANNAVKKAYKDCGFRNSIVQNALYSRNNTQTNTPCIVYTTPSEKDLKIEILIKGGGAENVSTIKMLSPTANEEEIIDFAVQTIKNAGAKACPPYFLGIGIGGTMDYASILSKKALVLEKNDEKVKNLAQKIQTAINDLNIGTAGLGGNSTVLDVKIISDFTHIACMPVAISVNCHSNRHASTCDNEYQNKYPENDCILEVKDYTNLKNLSQGEIFTYTGELYTARDEAHKRLVEMIENGENLPFDLNEKIIFYAGPCPCGSIGPTTAQRMDKYAKILYDNGVLATIGKGERSKDIESYIKTNKKLYLTTIGGIASFLSEKVIKKELVAFEDLGTEAIYRLEVKKFPLRAFFV